MNNIYIRQEGVTQKRTKAQKGVRGEGIGGCANMTNLEHTNDPLPKAVGFIYFYENPFKTMNVSSSEKLFSFLRYLQFSHGCLKM